MWPPAECAFRAGGYKADFQGGLQRRELTILSRKSVGLLNLGQKICLAALFWEDVFTSAYQRTEILGLRALLCVDHNRGGRGASVLQSRATCNVTLLAPFLINSIQFPLLPFLGISCPIIVH